MKFPPPKKAGVTARQPSEIFGCNASEQCVSHVLWRVRTYGILWRVTKGAIFLMRVYIYIYTISPGAVLCSQGGYARTNNGVYCSYYMDPGSRQEAGGSCTHKYINTQFNPSSTYQRFLFSGPVGCASAPRSAKSPLGARPRVTPPCAQTGR